MEWKYDQAADTRGGRQKIETCKSEEDKELHGGFDEAFELSDACVDLSLRF